MDYMSELDSQFYDGVWYDEVVGQFCRFSEVDGEVVLTNPDTGDKIVRLDPSNVNEDNYKKVPEDAVTDPAQYLQNRVVDMKSGDSVERMAPKNVFVGLQYADAHTEIVNK